MMELRYVPIQVFCCALDLNKLPRGGTISECQLALSQAEDAVPFDDNISIKMDPFSQSVAEYLSATGEFAAGKGEFGEIGGKFCLK